MVVQCTSLHFTRKKSITVLNSPDEDNLFRLNRLNLLDSVA